MSKRRLSANPNFDWHWVEQQLAPDLAAPHRTVPVDDADGWLRYREHNWVYDKLKIAQLQGLACAPHGIAPGNYPVFSKPIMNLHGMGAGSARLDSADDYETNYQPGHMWMEMLTGRHVSTDVAVEAGVPRWWRHATGIPAGGGMFDYWTITADREAGIEAATADFIVRHLADFTGMINLETIGDRIIEMHLRITDQWPDAYGGSSWIDALKRLFATGRWTFADDDRRSAFSVALFGALDGRYRHPPARSDRGASCQRRCLECADDVPRGPIQPLARQSARRLSPCRHQRLRPCRLQGGPPPAGEFHGLDRIINDTET